MAAVWTYDLKIVTYFFLRRVGRFLVVFLRAVFFFVAFLRVTFFLVVFFFVVRFLDVFLAAVLRFGVDRLRAAFFFLAGMDYHLLSMSHDLIAI